MKAVSRLAISAARSLWQGVAPAPVRAAVHRALAPAAEPRVLAALKASRRPATPGDILVSGLIAESKGVSQAARLTVRGLEAAGLAPVAHDIRPILDIRPRGRLPYPDVRPGGAWLLHVNAPEAIHVLAALDPAGWRDRFRIGYWAWELPHAPPSWVGAARAFDEIWVPSRFVAEALAGSGVTVPVRIIPHPAALDRPKGVRSRARFGLPEEALVVLAMGDLDSSATRKNLAGAIEIFRRAWPAPARDVMLVVKTQSDAEHPSFQPNAMRARQGRDDIRLIPGKLPIEAAHDLIASADILLSPHRSEGFGLTLAEAFLLDAPVLATGWSGNMDFMPPIPEALIAHRLAPVDDPDGVYPYAGQVWAEPDAEDAAAKLRALAASPELRKRIAAAGRAAVESLSAAWSADGPVAKVLAPLWSGKRP